LLSLSFRLFLSFSVSHIHTHTHTNTHMHTHMLTHSHTHARAHTRVYTHTRTHTRQLAHTPTCTHARAHMQTPTHTRTHGHTHGHTDTHARERHTYTHIHTHTHTHIDTRTHVHTDTRTHGHTDIHTRAHAHAHTHTQTPPYILTLCLSDHNSRCIVRESTFVPNSVGGHFDALKVPRELRPPHSLPQGNIGTPYKTLKMLISNCKVLLEICARRLQIATTVGVLTVWVHCAASYFSVENS
jgi:hypothetical protein